MFINSVFFCVLLMFIQQPMFSNAKFLQKQDFITLLFHTHTQLKADVAANVSVISALMSTSKEKAEFFVASSFL